MKNYFNVSKMSGFANHKDGKSKSEVDDQVSQRLFGLPVKSVEFSDLLGHSSNHELTGKASGIRIEMELDG